MLTVKRQTVSLLASGPRFPAAEGDASRVALREGSSSYWNITFHREFGNKSAGHCRRVRTQRGRGGETACPQVRRRLCTPYRVIIRCSTGL